MATPRTPPSGLELEYHPLTPGRRADFERLFGPRGASAGCWCMFERLTRSEWERRRGDDNKVAMRAIVQRGEVPGLIAYAGGEPAGWCSVGPRDAYPSLDRSRILQRVDDLPVWSVVCFFVPRPHRGNGITTGLLRAAVAYARAHGARVIEGYPVDPQQGRLSDLAAWHGTASAFRQAGFVEVLRRSPTRPIMRYVVEA
jgi:GNAT superfamily N-acetyltransferase